MVLRLGLAFFPLPWPSLPFLCCDFLESCALRRAQRCSSACSLSAFFFFVARSVLFHTADAGTGYLAWIECPVSTSLFQLPCTPWCPLSLSSTSFDFNFFTLFICSCEVEILSMLKNVCIGICVYVFVS